MVATAVFPRRNAIFHTSAFVSILVYTCRYTDLRRNRTLEAGSHGRRSALRFPSGIVSLHLLLPASAVYSPSQR